LSLLRKLFRLFMASVTSALWRSTYQIAKALHKVLTYRATIINTVPILGGGIRGFSHIFENLSPPFFERQGKKFTSRKMEKDHQM
jgi:hypothetical protein